MTIFKILRTKGLLSRLKGFLKNILRCLKIRQLVADFRVGLDDPADTGLLFALVGPATHFLSYRFPCQIRMQPSFDDKTILEGYLRGVVRLQPIQLVIPVAKFTFSLATIRAAKTLVLEKWRKKK